MENALLLDSRMWVKEFARALLTAVASFFLAFILPSISGVIRALGSMSPQKATGVTAVAAGLMEAELAPWFWLTFIFWFACLYAAGHSQKSGTRTVLFWIPAGAISVFGLGCWMSFTLLMWRFGAPR